MQTRLRKTGLTASIAIIALSVILAVGSTFSLFTSNDGNDITISSANVSVISKIVGVETFSLGEKIEETFANSNGEITETNVKFANNGKAEIKGADLEITNMTPGDEAKVTIGIKNDSTVRIAYRLKVTVTYERPDGISDDVVIPDLSKVIVVSASQNENTLPKGWIKTDVAEEEIANITVSVLLPVEIGNDYQNGIAKVSFAIEAVQANAAELTTVTTADQLYAALKTNGNAILLNDITLDRALAVDGVATLDLNGKTLTGNIVNEGNLIIKDSMGAVTADASGETTESPSGKFVGSITNKGTLAITGGSFKNDSTKEEKTAIITNTAAATLTIANADFASTGAVAIDNAETATLVIESGSFASTVGEDKVFPITYKVAEGETKTEITISGGSFSGEVPEEILPENLAGAPSTDENGNPVIVISKVIINAGNEKYSTLQHALDKANDVITLLDSITLDEAVVVKADRNVTIDLNGKTISGEFATDLLVNNGTLVIKNGTIKNTAVNGGATINNAGTLTLAAGANIVGAPIAAGSHPSYCILNSANLTVQEGASVSADRGCIRISGDGETVINGGTFTNNDLGDRTLTSHVVYVESSANNILTINGGTFAHLHTKTSGGVVINNSSRVTAYINGGSFSGGNYFGKWDNLSDYGSGFKTPFVVTGGTFTGMDNNFLAEGAVKINNDDGTFTIYKAGDTIVMNAGATLDLGGVAFDGYVEALGDLTIKGKVTIKNISLASGSTITIGEGACLELTGTDRMVIGHGVTFNITGTIADAKTANVAELTPSLIVAEGASFTGTGLNFNVTKAYVKFNNNSTSKNSNANGTFNFCINNSIWEQTGVLAFYVPTSGMDPTFNLTLKDSVLNTSSHLVFSVTKGEVVIDNSNVNVGARNQIENRSTMTIKNGSVVNGAVATSSNAKNPGTLIVENATYDVTGEFSGSDLGIGTLVIKKGAIINIGSISKANIVIDANAIIDGALPNFTANLSKFVGEISFIVSNSDELAAAIQKVSGGKIYLKAGDYTVRFTNNTSFNVDNITLIGIGDVTLSVSSSEAWYGRVQGSNVTFENIHFTSTVGATGKATYNNCTFDSWAICASSNNEETYYNNCTFKGCLNTSTDLSSGDVYANNCSIEKAEYSGSMTMYFENCTIEELISWDAKTVLTRCTVTTLDNSHMSSNEIVVNP